MLFTWSMFWGNLEWRKRWIFKGLFSDFSALSMSSISRYSRLNLISKQLAYSDFVPVSCAQNHILLMLHWLLCWKYKSDLIINQTVGPAVLSKRTDLCIKLCISFLDFYQFTTKSVQNNRAKAYNFWQTLHTKSDKY